MLRRCAIRRGRRVVRSAGADEDDAIDPAPSEAANVAPATGRSDGPGPVLEPADVGLALRYVADYGVVVAVHVTPEVLAEAAAAAAYAEAHLVVVVEPGSGVPDGVAADALVIELAERGDADTADPGPARIGTEGGGRGGTGAGDLLGRYAAAVDRGDDRAAAYAAMTAAAAAGSA